MALLFSLLLLALVPSGAVHAKDDGIYNRSNGCSCHGASSSVSAQLTGLPSTYAPGTTYTLGVAVSGSPATGGFNLEVSKGALSNPDANSQVSGNGLQATHDFSPGTTSWTLDWTAPAAGSGTAQFNLAVLSANNNGGSSGDGFATTSTSVAEAVSTNDAPEASNLALTPAQPTTVDAVTVTYTFFDIDGDSESGTAFVWHRNGAVENAHTTATLPASATSKGETWFASVTPSDGENSGATVNSPTVTVLNSAPTVLNLAVSDEAPDTTDDVTFTFASNDADGDTVTSSESRWRLDGTPHASLGNESVLPALATRPGDVWDVQVRVSDGETHSEWFTSAPVVIGSTNQAPVVSDATVEPSLHPTTADALTLSWSESDADGDAIVETELSWSKNGEAQPQFDNVNPLPAEHTAKGDVWQATVRVSDGLAWSNPESGPAVTVANAAPVVTDAGLESISFSALDKLVLNVTATDLDGDEASVHAVTWYMDGVAQASASDAVELEAAVLVRGDVWYATVTLTDGTDISEAFTTPSVTVVNAAPTVVFAWPASSSALVDLAPELTVSDVDGDVTDTHLSWFKNGFRDASLENATSVPAAKLAPGQVWRVDIQATDGDRTSPVQEHTFTVPNLAPTAAAEVRSTHVWIGETTVLSAETSSDEDGDIQAYVWSWNGQSATGPTLALVLAGSETVTLTVTDTNGATDTTTVELVPVVGPSVTQLQATAKSDGSVELTWAWDGEVTMFNVLRNGAVVGQTDSVRYTDFPLMSGSTAYTVQPFDENRVFLAGADDTGAEVDPVEAEAPAPSATSGFVLGAVLLLAMAVLPWIAMRRGGGES